MSNYSFMKTGSNNSMSELNKDDIENINALILVLIENSLELASKYIEHGNRNIITNQDIKNSIKLETIIFLNRKNIFDKANNILLELRNNIDINTSLDNILNKQNITDNDYTYKKNNCNCDICSFINNIDDIWNKWEPKSPIETILKNNIDKM